MKNKINSIYHRRFIGMVSSVVFVISLALLLVSGTFGYIMLKAGSEDVDITIKLDKEEDVTVGNTTVTFGAGGNFVDVDGGRALLFGATEGPKAKISPFIGEKGSIFFDLKYVMCKSRPNMLINRHALSVRGKGRLLIIFYSIQTDQHLFFYLDPYTEPEAIKSKSVVEPEVWHRIGATWDGEFVRFYVDGVLQGENKQSIKAEFPDGEDWLYFGAYTDGSNDPAPWNEDTHYIRNLRLLNRALTPGEAMRDAGLEVPDAFTRFPTLITVPRISAPITIDGNLNKVAWSGAASPVALINMGELDQTLSLSDNRPLFLHDGANLYIAFEYIFPAGANIVEGTKRTGDDDVESWGSDSFEFYMKNGNDMYRFSGNVAGGTLESKNSDNSFKTEWKYVSDLSVQIDNTKRWRGEIAIPFASLGITAATTEISINFCRSFFCFEQQISTSFVPNSMSYSYAESFATLRFSTFNEAVRTINLLNPEFGTLNGRLDFTVEAGRRYPYTVSLLTRDGSIDPVKLVEGEVAAGGSKEAILDAKIIGSFYDALLFEVKKDNGVTLYQQVIPFKQSSNFINVTPVFGKGFVRIETRFLEAKDQAGDVPLFLIITDPTGKLIYSSEVISDTPVDIPFSRTNPAGDYVIALKAGVVNATESLDTKTMAYSGIGAWESMPPITEVLPPFTGMAVEKNADNLSISMYGRVYHYSKSMLPATVKSAGKDLLRGAIELRVNGQPVQTNNLTAPFTADYRVELSAAGGRDGCTFTQDTWIEYDGVMMNHLKLNALQAISDVKVVIPFKPEVSKFVHATGAGFGAGGRENHALGEGNVGLHFYPVVWVGEYESGLTFFAETNATWKNAPSNPYLLRKTANGYDLEVTLSANLNAGETLDIEYGLLATPVKPLPDTYPLNVFNSAFAEHWNKPPPAAPVDAFVIAGPEGAGFFDLPLGQPNGPTERYIREQNTKSLNNHAVFTPYSAANIIPEEYPEVMSNLKEWQRVPKTPITYTRDGKTYDWHWLCPNSGGADYYVWKFREMLKRIPLRGIYFDFGVSYSCDNELHGCHNTYPMMAMRRFYQGITKAFVDAGVSDYGIVIHNSETMQIPTLTHVTHVLNGEGLRQMSSSVFHDGKDLLDTYTILDFASEHNSLPFGLTSTIYVPIDPLLPQFGGGNEDPELYKFRMTLPAFAGALIHGVIPSSDRLHYGLFNKLVRFYDEFGVPRAEFLPYWRNSDYVTSVKGKNIYVSLYKSADKPEVLAVISHVAKAHDTQEVEVTFNPEALGFESFVSAQELFTSPDPQYERLYSETNRVRVPVKLGDFGVQFHALERNTVKLKLDFHKVALVKLTAAPITGQDYINTGSGALKASSHNGMLHVSGLTAGKPFQIYNMNGVLIYESIAATENTDIQLSVSGVHVVKSENKTIKVILD